MRYQAYQFIQQHQKQYAVSRQCRVLDVSRSAYYAWSTRQKRGQHSRVERNQKLRHLIKDVFARHQGRYGRARLDQELRDVGWSVGGKRIARLLSELGLCSRQTYPPRPKRVSVPLPAQVCAANLLNRTFAPSQIALPNRVWCSDITFLSTRQGWLYLAVVMDLYSRRIIGWSMNEQPTQQLALDALGMALKQRIIAQSALPQSALPRGLLHHSDQGCQYTSYAYQNLLRDQGLVTSLSRRGNCHDNAPVESFFATIKRRSCITDDAWVLSPAATAPGGKCSSSSKSITIDSEGTRHWDISRPASSRRTTKNRTGQRTTGLFHCPFKRHYSN